MKNYEILMVLRPDHEEERIQFVGMLEKYINTIGELEKEDNWGLKRLAYPIYAHPRDYYEGIYMLLTFKLNTVNLKAHLTELDKKCKINDACLRHMIISKGE